MKKFILLVSGMLCVATGWSQQGVYPYDLRSDTLNVFHYDTHLDFRNFSSAQLSGWTRVHFSPLLQTVNTVSLDLLGPQVDSVKSHNGAVIPFTSVSGRFTVQLPSALSVGDSSFVDVYYHGPVVNDGQFGGFFFNANYAYNVGVSLSDIPHNYGKTWFPCQDNFVNRSTFDLYVTSNIAHKSAGGGVLLGTVVNPDNSHTQHWKINQPIPAYLASVAVSNYAYVNNTFSGVNGPVPVTIAVRPTDSLAVLNSFVNLENAFDIYESAYGPYQWDRVGYAITPMTGGAMEHAMNIAYPKSLSNGSTTYQDVMAHELSHHWWGNLVTCRTAEDMWINEGSASYSEYVFREGMNGRPAYESAIRANHKSLLQTCHVDDEGYWPLSGMPQEHTYGTTTYSKGADFIHTLRGYLGDSLFFSGLRQLLATNEFSDMDAAEYRDKLSAITGVNLDSFFNDWIFQGGWPHISIDSLTTVASGQNFNVSLYLRQKLTGRPDYSHHVPVTVTFRAADWSTYKTKVYSDGQNNLVTVSVPFNPVMAYLNDDELISHAVTASYETVETTGTKLLSHSNLTLVTNASPDSSFVLVEHNWTAPDPIVNNVHSYTISQQRYWRIDGIFAPGFEAKATFRYSGAPGLDDLLITGSEDSVILLYREDRASDWSEFDGYTKAIGSAVDKTGTVTVNTLKKGEYAFGMKGLPLGIDTQPLVVPGIFPNPAEKTVTVQCNKTMEVVVVTSSSGQLVGHFANCEKELHFDVSGYIPGTYFVSAYDHDGRLFTRQLIVK